MRAVRPGWREGMGVERRRRRDVVDPGDGRVGGDGVRLQTPFRMSGMRIGWRQRMRHMPSREVIVSVVV